MAGLASPAVPLPPSSDLITSIPLSAAFLACFSAYKASPGFPFLCYCFPFTGGKLPLQSKTIGEPPVYVNAKQYHRIIKRRVVRQAHGLHIKRSPGYLHESRHRHACSRPRGPAGTFLSKSQPAA